MKQLAFKLTLLTVLLVYLCGNAGAQSTEEIEWLEAEEYTLYWGEEVNASGYFIKAQDFSPSRAFDVDTDYVMISVLSDDSESWGTILALNNSDIPDHYVFEDRLNVSALDIVTGNDIPVPYTNISVAIANQSATSSKVVKKIDATISVDEKRSDEIYMDERAYIEIKIKNLKETPLEHVEVISPVPEEFIFDPDISPAWNFSLGAYGQKTIAYSLKALKPGNYTLAGTEVLVDIGGRTYTKTLNDSQMIIHGPDINLTKSVSSDIIGVGGTLDVDIIVNNSGDRATYVSVSDELPFGAVLLSGDTSGSKVLHPADTLRLRYSIRMDKGGEIVIPSVKAESVDSKEYEQTVYSKRFFVRVSDQPVIPDYEKAEEEPVELSAENTVDTDDSAENDVSENTAPVVEEDHGMLQPLYDLLDRIKGLL
ncbi:MAG: hypothetical protein AWU59_2406 [Methanolobus sp. T82-4]|nr:MAG: hypothetical protein AWU59_2406 [Methanolobus sp. T82-4]